MRGDPDGVTGSHHPAHRRTLRSGVAPSRDPSGTEGGPDEMGVRRLLRRRPVVRTRTCTRCGSALVAQQGRKYDAFWTTALIWAGAWLAFYVIGVALMFAGLWMRTQKITRWTCPACVTISPAPKSP